MIMYQRNKSTFNTYLNAIGKYPLLTAEQEIDLGRKVQRRQELLALDRELTPQEKKELRIGERAHERYVNSNLRLVVSVAKRYYRMAKSMDLMDLVQEGNVGLVTAVERFDPSKGYKFSTYAYWWIRQALTRAVYYKDRAIRLPGNVGAMAYTWASKVAALQKELQRVPTHQELADAFDVSVDDLELFLERGGHVGSLDAVLCSGDGSALVDMVCDPNDPGGAEAMDGIMQSQEIASMEAALLCLTEREQDMVKRKWGLGGAPVEVLNSIGQDHGLSRERVRQILEISYRKLRYNMSLAGAEPRTVLDRVG